MIQRQLDGHRVLDVRLAAFAVLDRAGRLADADRWLARLVRHLHQPSDGLARALAMARARDGTAVRQALLAVALGSGPCATACAIELLAMVGVAREPFDAGTAAILAGLGPHVSSRDHAVAAEAFVHLAGITPDPDAPA